ncbi:hypothetical protein [Acetobacter lovaniensis]|uniref:Uncharacterized protein n=1 Tax=Acetobacter lovaniensis TaxID=104100 RepID=A0A841QFX6_9PROT|nr:hypothetical protein [Acetobacter lovaniensis]MBB6456957.1 hypothetical protein [Acetobacter lovaniensis]NHN81054.1 hypothetical protein [Acetobacter lovaniensis]
MIFEGFLFCFANGGLVNFGGKQLLDSAFIQSDSDSVQFGAKAAVLTDEICTLGRDSGWINKLIARLVMRNAASAEAQIVKIVKVGNESLGIKFFKLSHPCTVWHVFQHMLEHPALQFFIQHFWFSMTDFAGVMVRRTGRCGNTPARVAPMQGVAA